MKKKARSLIFVAILALVPVVAALVIKGYLSLHSRANYNFSQILVSPERLESSIGSQGLVDILLLSNGNSLYGGDIKLSYDPAAFRVLGFDQNSDSGFGTYMVDWDNDLGTARVSFAIFNNGFPTPPVSSENPINLGQLRFQVLGGGSTPVLTVVYNANNASIDSNLVANNNGEPLDVLGEPTASLSFYHRICHYGTHQCVEVGGVGPSSCVSNGDCVGSPLQPRKGIVAPGPVSATDSGKVKRPETKKPKQEEAEEKVAPVESVSKEK